MRQSLALLLLVLGCDGATEPEAGTLIISVWTVGGDLDLDGYQLLINDGPPGVVGLTGTIRLQDYPVGSYIIRLAGLADNCELTRAPLQAVTVRPNETTRVEFEVTCYPTGIVVLARTDGLDPDPDGYVITVGDRPPVSIGPFGSAMVSPLTPGASYIVRASGVAANCQVTDGDSRTVQVESRQMVPVNFVFTCRATTGLVEVRASTSGDDLDPDGYEIRVANLSLQHLPIGSGVLRVRLVPAGSHTITISDVASNCGLGGQPAQQAVEVRVGGLTRDTTRVQYDVVCTRTDKIALVRGQEIVVMYADGSDQVSLGQGRGSPAWSPDGRRLAWEGVYCPYYYYYYYYYCQDAGLFVADADGASRSDLTPLSSDRDPAWSPDGTTIAFVRDGRLMLISPDGKNLRLSEQPSGQVAEPAWSPDGEWLAYTCFPEPDNYDICAIKRDGSLTVRLTSDSAKDSQPAWSPDGTRIAFSTRRYGPESIAHMSATDGSDVVRLDEGRSPSWSRDGQRLVYQRLSGGLSLIGLDGTGRVILTTGNDAHPAWRP